MMKSYSAGSRAWIYADRFDVDVDSFDVDM